jgi:DNA-binding LytR/AlgR family response regulator
MLRILIVEDEPLAAQRLIRLIKEIDDQVEILETLDTVKSATEYLRTHVPDLIFMDIHLADGNSFSIFEQVEVKAPIIFATAYDQYAIRAFKLNSVDYLLKPIEKEELAHSLQKYKDARPEPVSFDLKTIMETLQGKQPEYQRRFMVTSGEKIKSVPVEEIAYFFGQQKYVFLITRDNRRHIVDCTLSQLEEMLDPDRFFRINRQFIIHFDAIQHMVAYSNSRVKVDLNPTPDMEAIVSIEKSRHFKEWLNR